jgi:hypothetical protein
MHPKKSLAEDLTCQLCTYGEVKGYFAAFSASSAAGNFLTAGGHIFSPGLHRLS